MNLRPPRPERGQTANVLEYLAIFVAFADVCSHSVHVKLWPNQWPDVVTRLNGGTGRGFKTEARYIVKPTVCEATFCYGRRAGQLSDCIDSLS